MYGSILIYSVILAYSGGTNAESDCTKGGAPGLCVNIRNCQSALIDIRNRRNPQICWFEGSDPIVCCVDSVTTTTAKPVATTTSQRTTSTTQYIPAFNEYETYSEAEGGCEALSPQLTSKKTGQKAWDKCIEYQEQLVYPCEKGVALTGELSRANHCNHNADELIIGGVDAARGEFPHMVLLGYGDDPRNAQWLCGGTLVSDRYILTAGHCTYSRDFGDITYAILGSLKRTDQIDASKLYKIKQIIKHPEYKPPSKYNDIALLETETQMKLDQFAIPACLHIGNKVNDDKAAATGWGATQYRGSSADTLQKVTLTKFTSQECAAKFPPTRLMKQGYNETTQMCYGDRTMSKDTCQGDSGGPITIKNSNVHCMYTVVGVTSFGKACGFIGEPGIYTRVSAYVPWIESVVWP